MSGRILQTVKDGIVDAAVIATGSVKRLRRAYDAFRAIIAHIGVRGTRTTLWPLRHGSCSNDAAPFGSVMGTCAFVATALTTQLHWPKLLAVIQAFCPRFAFHKVDDASTVQAILQGYPQWQIGWHTFLVGAVRKAPKKRQAQPPPRRVGSFDHR